MKSLSTQWTAGLSEKGSVNLLNIPARAEMSRRHRLWRVQALCLAPMDFVICGHLFCNCRHCRIGHDSAILINEFSGRGCVCE